MSLSQAQKDALLSQLATGTKETSVDGLTVKSSSAGEIIEALKYAASCDAVSSRSKRPYRINHMVSPGTIYGRGR